MSTAPLPVDWSTMLLTLCVATAVAVALAAVLQRVLGRSGWHKAVWQTAILALAVLVTAEATGVADGLAGWFSIRLASRDAVKPCGFTAAPDAWQTEIPWNLWVMSDLGASSAALTSAPSELDEMECYSNGICDPISIEPAEEESSVPMVPAEPPDGSGPPVWPMLAWLGGAGVLMARIGCGRILLSAFCRRRAVPADMELESLVRGVAERMQVRFRVRVLVGGPMAGPMAFGVFRPAIGLPDDFRDRFDVAQQEAMIAHELAHLAGRDPAWHLLADVVTAALWWHPAAWWARARLRAASEFAADTACAVVPDGADVLAACLVQIGARLIRPRSVASLAIEGSGFRSSLGRRVHRLLTNPPERWIPPHARRSTIARTLCLTALVFAALTCTAWSRPVNDAKGATMLSSIERSWKQSLAAFALAGIFCTGDPSLADEPETNAVVAGSNDDDAGKKGAKKVKVTTDKDKERHKEKLEAIERKMKALHEAGKQAEAEELEREYKVLVQQHVEKAVKDKTATGADALDKLRERIRRLEDENAKLREALHSGRAKQVEFEYRLLPGESAKKSEGEDAAKIKRHIRVEHDKVLEDVNRSIQKIQSQGNTEQAEQLAAQAKEMAERIAASAKQHAERLAVEAESAAKQLAEKQPELAEKILEAQRAAAKFLEHSQHQASHAQQQKPETRKTLQFKVDGTQSKDSVSDLAQMLKQLREDLSRLRDEVAELRTEVKGEKAVPKR